MYTPYADRTFYKGTYEGKIIPDDDLLKQLCRASRHIDSLTYNRIVGHGFNRLTEFQQNIIKNVVCQQAEFEYQNKEVFDMVMSGYSINGVSMQFGESWNVSIKKGIPIRHDLYEQLSQTGLCCGLLR